MQCGVAEHRDRKRGELSEIQDIMVRRDETAITAPSDLKGRKVCTVAGSTSAQSLDPSVIKVEANSWANCLSQLDTNAVDAVTNDDLLLAGLATAQFKNKFKLINKPSTEWRYGIGLKKGDTRCTAVNTAISKMYLDGTAKTLFEKYFGGTGLTFKTSPAPQPEGC